VIVLSFTAWLTQGSLWHYQGDLRYLAYLLTALIATRLRVTSRVTGDSSSMSFVFVLIALVELNVVETTLIAWCAILLDGMVRRDRDPVQTLTNLMATGSAALATQLVYRNVDVAAWHIEWPVRFVVASLACYAGHTLPLLALAAASGNVTRAALARTLYLFSFPYYVVAATVTAIYAAVQPFTQWYATLALIPLMFLLHLSLRRYAGAIDHYRKRAVELSDLHLRTMEGLSVAIERDQINERHLQRLQVYSLGIGRELGMGSQDLEALRAAALLHDIGKLGVPDHVTAKPGRLTPEEFEKVKVHTLIGEGIVESARFPYPVAPLVRSHHERWDGSGYPDGLRAEGIPLGARILAVADCVDALSTERPYRPALPIDEAVAFIHSKSGSDFDPKVVEILVRKYRQFERTLSARGPQGRLEKMTYLKSISAARTEMAALFDVHEQLSGALDLQQVAHVLRTSFRDLVPYDALALYTTSDPDAKPELVCGDRSLIRRTRQQLTMNMEFSDGRTGRMVVFTRLADRLRPDHVRTLRSLVPRVAQAVENGRRFAETSESATIDYLTGLPNTKALFERLESETAAAGRNGTELVVLVCDLDGFKSVNDTFGHLTGNRVLQQVSTAFARHTRGADYVARLGGDEFVLILPGHPAGSIAGRVEDLRELVRAAGMSACGMDMIDGSFGAASYPVDGLHADELVAAADHRMYDEKKLRKAAVNAPLEAEFRPAAPSIGTVV